MLDVAASYNRYRFLGNEFLTWLWFLIETDPDQVVADEKDEKDEKRIDGLQIGNRIVLENKRSDGIEKVTIKGDAAGLEEGLTSLYKGGLVTELNIFCDDGENKWQFSIKGESLELSNIKTSATGAVETSDDVEGAIIEKLYYHDKLYRIIDNIFKRFIVLRLSDKWKTSEIGRMKKWIVSSYNGLSGS